MHVTSHAALDYIPPTVYSAFRIGMAVPLLFVSARVQVRACGQCTLGGSSGAFISLSNGLRTVQVMHTPVHAYALSDQLLSRWKYHGSWLLCEAIRAVCDRKQEREFRPRWSDLPWFVILGIIGVATPQCLVYIGNKVRGNWKQMPFTIVRATMSVTRQNRGRTCKALQVTQPPPASI